MSMLNVFQVAGSALHAQSLRLNTTASNMANADSVVSSDGQPYRAKQVVFAATPMRLVYDPKSPAANAEGYVTMPNVNVVEEMTNMISASRAYQTNADVMGTAKTLLEKTLTIGQ